jgi:hypothetical protein
MSVQLTIDKEFEELIQPLADQELALLTEQILRDGCREPLSVWKTEDDQRILLDGHNRYKICMEHKRDFQTINLRLDSRDAAKLWILEHQVGRRNLTDDQRAVIWNEIREQRSKVASIEAAAKARAAKADSANSTETADQPTAPKVDTRKAVATESKIPESKLRKVQRLKKTNPKLYDAVRTGAVTLREVKPKPAEPSKKDLRARYSEKDFFARIGRMLAGTLTKHPLLDELLATPKTAWTPEAEHAFKCIIKNLDEVSDRAHSYANGLNKILRAYGKAKVAA